MRRGGSSGDVWCGELLTATAGGIGGALMQIWGDVGIGEKEMEIRGIFRKWEMTATTCKLRSLL